MNQVAPLVALAVLTALAVASASARPPSAPKNLRAESADGSVVLRWDDADGDVEWYYVYRATPPGGPYEQVDRMKKFRASSKMHGLVPNAPLTNGTTYYYVLKAESHSDEMGPPSNEASATPAAQARATPAG